MGINKKISLSLTLLFFVTSIYGQGGQIIDGHEYVDLGLSVNWASCNIGSNSPEEFGDYFAWGETFTKSYYNKMTYKFFGGKEGLEGLTDYTKYKGTENKLNPNDTQLEENDDVAHVLWGGRWRMPTMKEIEELVDSCEWVFYEINNIKGCWAISKVNGNMIFFPLAGYIQDDTVSDIGLAGKYWSSQIRANMCFEAYQLWISLADSLAEMEGKTSILLSDDGFRENGRSVRPVCVK